MGKRGISSVVATVLIILITVFAVSALWWISVPILTEEGYFSEGVELSIVTSEGYTVWDSESKLANVQVKRGSDDVKLVGIEFIFSVEGTSVKHTINETEVLAPGSKRTYTEFNIGNITVKPASIKVVPLYEIKQSSSTGQVIATGNVLSGNVLRGIVYEEEMMAGTVESTGNTRNPDGYETPILNEATSNMCLGDANNDGVVSAGDYASVQANFGNTGELGILGDANLDGIVSAGDYASVQANFGDVCISYIQISTCLELQAIENNLTVNYALVNNIDCSDTVNWNDGKGFEPIGSDGYCSGASFDSQKYCERKGGVWISNSFEGIFDGGEFEIDGLYINRSAENDVGLFSWVGTWGCVLGEDCREVKNVGLTNVDITGDENVGSLVGYNYGLVENSYSSGIVEGFSDVGGLIGNNKGKVLESYSIANVEGAWSVGGLIGTASSLRASDIGNKEGFSGVIVSSYATGDVIGDYDSVGGLVGYFYGIVFDSYATGNVNSGEGYVGGLVGQSYGDIFDSYATGIVTSMGSSGGTVGGLAGDSWGVISNSYAEGRVEGGDDEIGGLVGKNWGPISNSYATGDVIGGGDSIGGLVGYSDGDISNSYATGDVYGAWDYTGGLVGVIYGDISNSYAIGAVAGANNYVGGLAGANQGNILDSYYNNHVNNPEVCVGVDWGSSMICTTIQNDESYFYFSVNDPMDVWDFVSTWQEVVGDFPVLL